MKYLLLLIFSFLAYADLSAQCDTTKNVVVEITVKTDSFPKDIGWTLVANDNSVFYSLTQPGTYVEAEKEYKHTFCVPKRQCLRLFLTDSKGDGINYPGYVKITINGKATNYISYFRYADFEYINCSAGESCGTPETINEGNFVTTHNNYFYQFTPTQSGYYNITTCDTTNLCKDTKIWIYEECKTFNPQSDITGALLFSDNNGGCDKLAALPKAVLEKNRPYIIRIGGDSCKSLPIKWTLKYGGGIKGCMDTAACNYNYLATIPTDDCIPQNDTSCKGPDLIIEKDDIVRTLYLDEVNANQDPCLINEGCLNGFGLRKVLRFDTKIRNIGDQDYFIGKPYGNPTQFVYDNCHQHYHYRGYAEYLLYDDRGNAIPIGFKAGFCVLDFECNDTTNMKYSCVDMGLSAGCSDIYEKELACQWVDVTNVPDGKYLFVTRVNWDNSPDKLGRVESRNDNNWAQVCVELKRVNDSITFTLDTSNCEVYRDCKGVKYGSSKRDCKGDCGGKAIEGDQNNNAMQDYDDVQRYLAQAVNESGTPSPCDDLNADGKITTTDAAMLASCLNYGKRHIHVGSSSYHNHCLFPQKILNDLDTVFFKIQNHNPTGKYFDVAMYNPRTYVNGFQFKLSNANIIKVDNLTDTSRYKAKIAFGLNSRIVGGLSLYDSTVVKSPSYKSLVRIYYANSTPTKVNLLEISDVTDRDGYGAVGKVVGEGINITDSKDVQLMNLNVVLFPNPVANNATIAFYNPEYEDFKLEIFDINGKLITQKARINSNEYTFSCDNIPNGIYFYKMIGESGFATGKFVIQR